MHVQCELGINTCNSGHARGGYEITDKHNIGRFSKRKVYPPKTQNLYFYDHYILLPHITIV